MELAEVEESDATAEAAAEEPSDEEEAAPEIADVEEQVGVSEWPDPNKHAVFVSLDKGDPDDDKDASANG